MNVFTKWKDKVAHYVDVRVSLAKLSLIERASTVVSYLIFTFIAMFLSFAVLIFLGIGIAELFAVLIDSHAGGYFITCGIYLVLAIILVMARPKIISTFSGIFIRIMTDHDDDEELEIKQTSRDKVEVE